MGGSWEYTTEKTIMKRLAPLTAAAKPTPVRRPSHLSQPRDLVLDFCVVTERGRRRRVGRLAFLKHV